LSLVIGDFDSRRKSHVDLCVASTKGSDTMASDTYETYATKAVYAYDGFLYNDDDDNDDDLDPVRRTRTSGHPRRVSWSYAQADSRW